MVRIRIRREGVIMSLYGEGGEVGRIEGGVMECVRMFVL